MLWTFDCMNHLWMRTIFFLRFFFFDSRQNSEIAFRYVCNLCDMYVWIWIAQPYTSRQITCRGKQFVFIVNSFFCFSISSHLRKDQRSSECLFYAHTHTNTLAQSHRWKKWKAQIEVYVGNKKSHVNKSYIYVWVLAFDRRLCNAKTKWNEQKPKPMHIAHWFTEM